VVSLELRPSAVTDRADVVLPVAAVAEKPGTFVNWEGRIGTFEAVLDIPGVESDLHVLRRIADEMDVHLGLPDAAAARQELAALGVVGGSGPVAGTDSGETAPGAALGTAQADTRPPEPQVGEALLVTWHQLLDAGRMQDGEPFLAGTARPVVARMSAATAAEAGTSDGGKVSVATAHGSLTLPVEVAVMPDRVVWLPTRSAGSEIRRELAAGHGSLVTLRSAE
jgi:NADH-quinone oxidoreductase subunit G